jgi:hypothetical protein
LAKEGELDEREYLEAAECGQEPGFGRTAPWPRAGRRGVGGGATGNPNPDRVPAA